MNEDYVFLGRMQPKTRDYIKNLERENRMLEHNWNELRKWLEEYYDYGDCLKIKFILNKMHELEEGGNNE